MHLRLLVRARNTKFSLFSKSAKAVLCARADRNNRKRQNTAYGLSRASGSMNSRGAIAYEHPLCAADSGRYRRPDHICLVLRGEYLCQLPYLACAKLQPGHEKSPRSGGMIRPPTAFFGIELLRNYDAVGQSADRDNAFGLRTYRDTRRRR